MRTTAGQQKMSVFKTVQKDVKHIQIAKHFTTMVQGMKLIPPATFIRVESSALNFQMEGAYLLVYVKRKVGFQCFYIDF